MKVEKLMTRDVRACRSNASLNEAAQIMWEEDCGCVPVLGGGSSSRVAGVVTDRDLCMAAYSQGKPLREIPIATAMAREIRSCTPDTDVKEAEALMSEAQVRRLVVLNDDGELCGLIALADLARAAAKPGRARDGIDLAEVGEIIASISREGHGAQASGS